MLAPERLHLALVEIQLRALVHLVDAPVNLPVVAGLLRRHRGIRELGHVVDPAAVVRKRLVRVDVVGLPERLGIGGHGEAADLDAVAHHPWHDHEGGHRHRDGGDASHPTAVAAQQEQEEPHRHGQQHESRVGEHGQPEHDAQPERAAHVASFRHGERQRDDACGERGVEDLAVDVDVVPEEVGVQRHREAGEEPGGRREPAATDPRHEQRRGERDQDLRDPDRLPAAAEDPVDRDQEERVERLRRG